MSDVVSIPRRARQRRDSLKEWLNTAAIAVVALLFAFPFIWMFLTALKPENEVFTATPQIFGSEIRWANFVEAWTVVPFGRFILNGLFVAILGAALSVIVAVLSAYAFSRLRFKYRDKLFLLFVLTLVLPQEVLVVQFLFAVLRGALAVTVQVFDFRHQPGAAIIAVPLKYADDLMMTHVSVVSSLVPGSLVVEADRDRQVLYLHVIGVRSIADVEKQRAGVLRWERRVVRALGAPAQYRALKADERAERAGSVSGMKGGAR